jgi:zinc and cadmium transporter
VGDVAILLAAGYSRGGALMLNLVSGASGLVGALVAYAAVGIIPGIRPFILAFSSASLLYIAMSDLIPDLHRGQIDANGLRQVLLIAAGIFTIVGFEHFLG